MSEPSKTDTKASVKIALIAGVCVVFSAAIGAFFISRTQGPTPAQSLSEDAQTLRMRFEKLESSISALQTDVTQLQNAPPPKIDASALEAKITELGAQIDAIKNSPSSAANLQQVALINGLTELQKSVNRGQPFSQELSQLTQLAKDRTHIIKVLSELKPFADSPVPTLTYLKNAFDSAVSDRGKAKTGDGSFVSNLRSLIRIRKEGMPEGNDDASIIARAETALNAGEVSASATELAMLSTEGAAFFKAWLEQANRYTKIHRTLSLLLAAISQAEEPQASPAPPDHSQPL